MPTTSAGAAGLSAAVRTGGLAAQPATAGEQDEGEQPPHQSTPCIRRFSGIATTSSTPPIAAAAQPIVVKVWT